MTLKIRLGDWEAQCQPAREVRTEVFIGEQNIPIEMEWDDMDAVSLHVVAYDAAGEPVGTARLLPDGHIGRMAVRRSARGAGVGGAMLAALIDAGRQRGTGEVMLNAQIHAEAFYARFGFVREGREFQDAGIAHIHMRYKLA